MAARISLRIVDVPEVGRRWAAARASRVIDADACADTDDGDCRPEVPLLVDRRAFRRFGGRLVFFLFGFGLLALAEPQPLGVAFGLLLLELFDQLFDLLAIVGLGLELEVALEAEDRSVVVTEV